MATYTVNITGNLNSRYGYATINGTTITSAGTKTYTSKPTISVYVGTGTIIDQNLCAVKLNGTTVKSGQGSYSLDFGDDNVVNISFTAKSSTGTYYTADITTQKTSSGGDSVDGGDGSEHYTLIGNAAREIEGGTVLIGGVLREIDSGLALVNGVAREIAFSNLPPVGTALNDCSWEDIAAISEAGMASNYWKVGDIKTITINGKAGATTFSNLSVDVFIIGFDHNSAKEGSNRIHFQIGKIGGKDVCLCDSNYNSQQTASGKFTMNTSNTNSGGWSSSHMRKTVLGSDSSPTSPTANPLLAWRPSDLRAVMKSVTKYSDNTGGGSNTASYVTATTDYLWLLSEF